MRLICPDPKTPPEPGGSVRRNPGLRTRKSKVVTTMSVRVRIIPIALATRPYASKKTSVWENTDILLVCPDVRTPFDPGGSVRRRPGLRTKKRTTGIITFWEVRVFVNILVINCTYIKNT
jgi:hypothetical protein